MTITANGIEFETSFEGPEDAPVVTMSHSLCCDLTAWDELAEDLKKDHRVLRYSLRGHGKSAPTPGPYDFGMLAADVASISFFARSTDVLGSVLLSSYRIST